MADIFVAVDYAIAQSGKPYHAYGARFGPDYYDCSGLVVASLRVAGVDIPAGVGNTVDLYNWAARVGGLVPVDKAAQTKGAILIKGKWYGYGPLGHTSFSLGDGREMAAHGTRRGIGISTLNASFYQDGFIIPGVDYHLAPPVDPVELARLVELDKWRNRVKVKALEFGERGPDVAILVDLFRRKHFLRKNVYGNAFGTVLRTGNVKFKDAVGLGDQPAPIKGERFGGDAADALMALQ